MPNVQTIRAGISELPQDQPLVVALIGATTGIGSYVAKTWATAFAKHGSKLRVYIVGRNAARAEVLLKYGRETSPGSDWRFVQVSDLALMQEVDRASDLIVKQEESSPFAGGPARLDALYSMMRRVCSYLGNLLQLLTDLFQSPQKVLTARCLSFTTHACGSFRT
jgi:NAD(P)-dependent dehydrogenase (short-subunit alcohol dehydrogenase family)